MRMGRLRAGGVMGRTLHELIGPFPGTEKRRAVQPGFGECQEIVLGRKVMTNLDRVLKSRDITWPTKVHIVKAMVFPVVIYGHELVHKEG